MGARNPSPQLGTLTTTEVNKTTPNYPVGGKIPRGCYFPPFFPSTRRTSTARPLIRLFTTS